VIDDAGYILDGNHRALAAQKAWLQTVPVYKPVEKVSEVKQRLDAKCWKGKHKEGTKIKGGVRVNNCVPNESVAEAWSKKYKRSINCSQPKGFTMAQLRKAAKAPGTTLDEIIKMPPNTTATSSGLVRWSYDDSMEKGAKPTKVDLVKGKQSLMFDLGDHLKIFVMLGDKPIFCLSLGRYADGYKVGVVNTEPEARGQGIGINIYAALADHLNKPIYSDRTQSDASRLGIWQKLIDRFPGRVVGYDPKTKEDLPLAQGPAGPAVRGQEPIYAPKKGPADRGNTEATFSRTRLLKLLPAGDGTALGENFADGKGPGRSGDSQRHGIPKHATKAELEKASHAKGRKGQLARWQLNMRNGKKN